MIIARVPSALWYSRIDRRTLEVFSRLDTYLYACASRLVNGYPFLDDSVVPAYNKGTEWDIRSLAARSDGGTHRTPWSAATFTRLKSVIVIEMKNQVRFIRNWIDMARAKLRDERLPLPLAATLHTS